MKLDEHGFSTPGDIQVSIPIACRSCNKCFEIQVDSFDHWKWQKGLSMSKAFPYLTKNDQGLLESNVCYLCATKGTI